VVSHDAFNETENWRSVIVVPVSSSKSQARRGPTAVPLPAAPSGLHSESVALCHQVTTLDRRKLTKRLGSLPRDTLAAVGKALKTALDLD
jgi:mRNA-degrading endonuclease toxin of MazEF toxin-antitoxin module